MKGLKIKVCGMREAENINEVAQLPIDMMGFIFYPGSSRAVGKPDKLVQFLKKAQWPREIQRVGVFVNAEVEEVLNKIHDFELDYIQLHGGESPGYCAELQDIWRVTTLRKARIIKAFSIGAQMDFKICTPFAPYCDYFLFDTQTPGYGGSGTTFNWELLEGYEGKTPFLLSGGIGPETIELLLGFSHPRWAGIDVNSRFETAPGLKNGAALTHFIQQLRQGE